jgi:RNA polymerase sigma-70 factor (ECF subfamily)
LSTVEVKRKVRKTTPCLNQNGWSSELVAVTSSMAADGVGDGDGRLVDGTLTWVVHVESFDGFYAREYSSLVAMAFALTGSRSHAEDVAQEAMLIAYRRWDDVSRLDVPAAWVRRVCANTATSLVRRRIIEARAVLRLRARPVAVVELDETDSAFWAEVRRLPRRQAQCVALRYVYGCSVAEIAGILGCADGTVKSQLWHARARLAERLVDSNDEEGSRS